MNTNQKFSVKDIMYCGLFAALIAIGAFIKIMIPLGVFEVTFSLQFLFSMLAGFVLGRRKGFITVVAYLLIGLLGVPIFAHGGGLFYLMKPTFGFLIGFAIAAYVCGAMTEKLKKITFPKLLLAAFVGEVGYYIAGAVYYYIMFNFVLSKGTIGVWKLLNVWVFSTFIPDFALCVIASLLAYRLMPIFRRGRRQDA